MTSKARGCHGDSAGLGKGCTYLGECGDGVGGGKHTDTETGKGGGFQIKEKRHNNRSHTNLRLHRLAPWSQSIRLQSIVWISVFLFSVSLPLFCQFFGGEVVQVLKAGSVHTLGLI